MKRKDRLKKRAEGNYPSVSYQLADLIQTQTGLESRVVNPGHYLRGGSPSPYDRILATQFGAYAAHLIKEGNYGQTVAMIGGKIGHNSLKEVAGKTKFVSPDLPLIQTAKDIGISFGVK